MSEDNLFLITGQVSNYGMENTQCNIIKDDQILKTVPLPLKFDNYDTIVNTTLGLNVITWYDNKLYVIGDNMNAIYVYDGNNFKPIDLGFKINDNTRLYNIITHNNRLYISGNDGKTNKSYLAYYDGTSAKTIDNVGVPSCVITKIVSNNNLLYFANYGKHTTGTIDIFDSNTNQVTKSIKIPELQGNVNGLFADVTSIGVDYNKNVFLFTMSNNYIVKENNLKSIDNSIAIRCARNITGLLYIGGFKRNKDEDEVFLGQSKGDGTFVEIETNLTKNSQIFKIESHNDQIYVVGLNEDDSIYLAKYVDENTQFKIIYKNKDFNRILSLYSPPPPSKKNNLPLILGLAIGLGIPLIILFIYLFIKDPFHK